MLRDAVKIVYKKTPDNHLCNPDCGADTAGCHRLGYQVESNAKGWFTFGLYYVQQ